MFSPKFLASFPDERDIFGVVYHHLVLIVKSKESLSLNERYSGPWSLAGRVKSGVLVLQR